jgi:exonuclease VII small subunit
VRWPIHTAIRRVLPATIKLRHYPKNWPLWAGLVLLFVAYQACWPPLWRAYLRSRVPSGHSGKISLLLARLQQDKNDDPLREIVRDAITQQLGDAVEVILWPETLVLGDGSHADAVARVQAKAKRWLKSKSCDVLVWGRVKSDTALALRFTVSVGSERDGQSYGLTSDTLELPVKFISDLGVAIAAQVVAAAAPAVHMSGHYLVPLMRRSAERLAPIVRPVNPAFDSGTRGSLLFSYALICSSIGEQAGLAEELEKAVAAYREALKEYMRDRVPLDWAITQNNLGNALSRLGEQESGTARLEEAVAAYREGLKEYTREWVPLDWAMTQNNLGNALSRLGERESGTARLEEAVAAYREALKEYTRKRVPRDWAMTQNNLGNALASLAFLRHFQLGNCACAASWA